MKLHETLVQKLLKVYEVNSGWTEERKLQEALRRLEFGIYTQSNGQKVLVAAEDLKQEYAVAASSEGAKERMEHMLQEAQKINRG